MSEIKPLNVICNMSVLVQLLTKNAFFISAGALSSVSNTLMTVVSNRYDGSKRNQEMAPLLQDQTASPDAHVCSIYEISI